MILSGTPTCRAGISNHLSVVEDMEKPAINSDQVLVRVKATALNIEDISVGAGEWPGVTLKPTKESPVVLGQEFAGVVEEVGSKVKNFKTGDAVFGHKVSFSSLFPLVHFNILWPRCRSDCDTGLGLSLFPSTRTAS